MSSVGEICIRIPNKGKLIVSQIYSQRRKISDYMNVEIGNYIAY